MRPTTQPSAAVFIALSLALLPSAAQTSAYANSSATVVSRVDTEDKVAQQLAQHDSEETTQNSLSSTKTSSQKSRKLPVKKKK